jgi:hypothetical protein
MRLAAGSIRVGPGNIPRRTTGKHAPGGKYNYIINGHMIAGFALVAWPAEWGNTGMMTFIVNQRGKIYQKNLGPKTPSVAPAMTTYAPDHTWMPANEK